MKRRTFLAAASQALCCLGNPARGKVRTYLKNDVGPLRSVIVHTPGAEVFRPADDLDELMPWLREVRWDEEGLAQHARFVKALRAEGVEVLELVDLLDDAIKHLRVAGRLEHWLEHHCPSLLDLDRPITAALLIGRERPSIAEDEPGPADEGPLPLKSLVFTRDIAVMTPKGVVLTSFLNHDRLHEADLVRLAFHAAPRLKRYPIAFDARREGVYLQGGDLMVLDEKTLLLGVGNLTEPAAAPKLAKRLGMDVVSVTLPGDGRFEHEPGAERWSPLRTMALHLDSVCTLLDEKRALVAPAFLEGTDTLSAMRGLCDDVRMMRRIGRVKTYRARTGEAVNGEKDQKLVDHLTERGYDCVRVGGPRPERPEETQAWTRLALAELFGQAANVVAIKPGHVLAYAGNEATLRALRAGGVTVRTIEGTSLARLHGGPHCLTLPLERDA